MTGFFMFKKEWEVKLICSHPLFISYLRFLVIIIQYMNLAGFILNIISCIPKYRHIHVRLTEGNTSNR